MRRKLLAFLFVEAAIEAVVEVWLWRRRRAAREQWWQGLWFWIVYGGKWGTKGEWIPVVR